MPDKRKHRGPHPADHELFSSQHAGALRQAVAHLSWLKTQSYSDTASLKLVGDRFKLTERQRTAVLRSSCSDQQLADRKQKELPASRVVHKSLWIDTFNVLTSVEAALGNGVILGCRDGAFRDMASMHGSYRKVVETIPAIRFTGRLLEQHGCLSVHWVLDRPVSNSGRLSQVIREVAAEHHWQWETCLVDDADPQLIQSGQIVASADAMVIDESAAWFNLARHVIEAYVPRTYLIDLS